MKKSIYSEENTRLVDWLREKRNASELTQRAVAQKLEWDNATIARVEKCQRRLDVVEYIDLCHVLGCDPREGVWLIMGVSEKKQDVKWVAESPSDYLT